MERERERMEKRGEKKVREESEVSKKAISLCPAYHCREQHLIFKMHKKSKEGAGMHMITLAIGPRNT